MGRSFDSGLAPTESQSAAAMLREIEGLKRQLACERALVAELQQAALEAQDQIANLEIALVSSRRIGAAMGVLMAGHRITDDQAFALLRTASQHNHRKLRDIADEVVLTGALPMVEAAAPRPDAMQCPRRERSRVPADGRRQPQP